MAEAASVEDLFSKLNGIINADEPKNDEALVVINQSLSPLLRLHLLPRQPCLRGTSWDTMRGWLGLGWGSLSLPHPPCAPATGSLLRVAWR